MGLPPGEVEKKEMDLTIRTEMKITLRLVISVLGAVMGSFLFGYNTGVINAPEAKIKEFLNETNIKRDGTPMSVDTQTNLFAIIVASFAIGGTAGGLLAGTWADKFGRKNGSLLNTICGIASAALMFFCRMSVSYEMLIVGRLLGGICCGLITGLTPIYLSEIASQNIRGALGVLHQLGVVSGILVSQILGFPEVMGTSELWNYLLGLAVVPCVLQLIILPFCPESPRHLLISKQDEANARKALIALRGYSDAEEDILEMKAEDEAQKSEAKVNIWGLLTSRNLRMALILSVVMHLSQQFSGIVAIFYYSSSFFKDAGLDSDTAVHATSGVGAVMVVMTIVTIPLMDKVGRRTLHLAGLGGMFVFSILITLTLTLKHLVPWFNIVTIVASLVYVLFFALGPGSIPWLIVAELFSQGPRSAAISVSVLVNWVANFGVGYAFPHMKTGLGNFSFIPFTGFLLVFFIFIYLYLPETKNKTFEEISSTLRGGGNIREDKNARRENYLVSYKRNENP
ncbi:glucose transporter type 1 isoform X1 [Patella vulgata]|uniref:glucose transporter type 1 isoform X1 n=2 Tax=Patella vulgata TaxID=6465 RepID=UPI00217FF23C|nr:glucose transporter type 1 isoform X1 [Patella vulgata]